MWTSLGAHSHGGEYMEDLQIASPGNLSLFPAIEQEFSTLNTTGILPAQRIEALIDAGRIRADLPIEKEQIQPASLDLRLGDVAYRVRASFLPSQSMSTFRNIKELEAHRIDLTEPAVLERGCVYIVPLMEKLLLPGDISGKSNPKSTTGRLDIFTRLITDHGSEFERIPSGYRGNLFVEIVPRTFSVIVRVGDRLNQIRFIRGNPIPSDTMLIDLHDKLAFLKDNIPADVKISKGLWISIDLQGRSQDRESQGRVVGYKAKKHTSPIDLSLEDYYEPLDYWDLILQPKTNQIILDPEEFYILSSKEKMRIPPNLAAELVAYDPSIGEFRIHYAGFFDPGFGYSIGNGMEGTQAVLEVRSHEVPFLLRDGQHVGRFIYERMLAPPKKIYGSEIGSSYQGQGLKLSKQFKKLSLYLVPHRNDSAIR
jgi:dCTP deaminase